MSADPDLHDLAARFGVNLTPATTYTLEDDGRFVLANGHVAGCPFACGDPHDGPHGQPGEGCSCPYRIAPLHECYPDPLWRDLKRQGTL